MRTGRRGTKTLIGLAAALMLFGAACSKSSTPSATATQPPATTQPQTTQPPASSSPSPAGVTVQQGAGGFVFTPATFSVGKGDNITVTNVGSAPHTFTITSKGIDVVNNPGQSQSLTIDLAPGTYPFICRFHVSLGMKGTLTVTG